MIVPELQCGVGPSDLTAGLDAQSSAAFTPEAMTKDERSCLLYLETRAVDQGGLAEGIRMNAEDHAAIERFVSAGLIIFSRLPARMLTERGGREWSHLVELTDAGWALAHELRRARALRRGPFAERAVEQLREMGKWPAPETLTSADERDSAALTGAESSPGTNLKTEGAAHPKAEGQGPGRNP